MIYEFPQPKTPLAFPSQYLYNLDSMLVLTVKKGNEIYVGSDILKIIIIYKTGIYVTYKDQSYRITNEPLVLPHLTIQHLSTHSISARIGLSSPQPIKRKPDERIRPTKW